MTNPDLARLLDAVANRVQVIIGVTTELRRSLNTDARQIVTPGAKPAWRRGVRVGFRTISEGPR
jgi:hypothetical protein